MRRRPLEHAAAMAALLLTFVAVTAGIGTVAAAASAPRPTPRVLPSAGLAAATAALARTAPPHEVRAGSNSGPRPGTSIHIPPPLPLAFSGIGTAPTADLPAFGGGVAAGILVDLDSHQVLWERAPTSIRPTASLAKVVTVMVAMDHAQSLDQVVTVPPGGEDDNPQDSVMGLLVGDRISVRDLVNGIWLASGDDAAETLARVFVPRDEFIAEMNQKATWLGLTATHFSNPSGLDDPGEYSSPYDLGVISGWLWTHYPAAMALAAQSFVPLGERGRDLSLRTLNKMVSQFPGKNGPYPGANGLKTGDTPNAGGCVIATAQRGGHRLIAVVMGSDWFFTDAGALLDYGFAVDG